MRKHPLIALIAFTFAAASIFISAAGASSIDGVPARATSRIATATRPSRPVWAGDLRWMVSVVRQREAAAAQAAAQLAVLRASPGYQDRAADLVAIHDIARGPRTTLPSAWRAATLAAAAHAAAAAALKAQEEQQLLLQQQQQQQQLQLQQQQQQQEQEALQAKAEAAAQAKAAATSAARAAAKAKASRKAGGVRTAPSVTTTTTTPAPTPGQSAGGNLGGVWLSLRLCESGDNYAEDTGNGYYGAYQFALSTWWGLGYGGVPSDASPAVQDQAAERLQAEAGWGQWPACSADLGL